VQCLTHAGKDSARAKGLFIVSLKPDSQPASLLPGNIEITNKKR
jgi:hypothetical protein